jgi:predicted nucleic acid-binding protein
MILADSSLWIDLLIDPGRVPSALKVMTDFATSGPIMQEVLQGLNERNPLALGFREIFLDLPRLSDPLPSDLFVDAAKIYSEGRRRGITIRSTTDCLIAAIAIHNDVPLWHRDRDFAAIARYTPLKAMSRYVI